MIIKNGLLPLFPGFYDTSYEPDEEEVMEDPFSFSHYEFDYEDYKVRVAESLCGLVAEKLNGVGIATKIIFKEVESPTYYNNATDIIVVDYSISWIDVLTKLIEFESEFEEFIKKRYTSRDGFISAHSNNHKEWLNQEQFEEMTHIYLEFILVQEGFDKQDLYKQYTDSNRQYLSSKLIPELQDIIDFVNNVKFKSSLEDVLKFISNLQFEKEDLKNFVNSSDFQNYIVDLYNEDRLKSNQLNLFISEKI